MIIEILVVALFLQTTPAEETYFKVALGLASGIGDTFVAAAEGPVATWSKLATPQARRVLSDLSSSAETLYEKNKILGDDLEKHIRNNTAREFNIDPRIRELRTQASDMEQRLEKFRHEVDQAVGAETHKRGDTEVAMHVKAERLADVDVSWKSGRYYEARESLREAMEELQRSQNGIACLQKSIDEKATECDENTLAPIKKAKP